MISITHLTNPVIGVCNFPCVFEKGNITIANVGFIDVQTHVFHLDWVDDLR